MALPNIPDNSVTNSGAPLHSWSAVLKLALALYLPVTLILTALVYGLLSVDVDTRLQKLVTQESVEVGSSEQLLIHDFDHAISDLHFLAQTPALRHYADEHSPAEKQRVIEHFRNMVQTKLRYDQIRYIDNSGMEIIRINLVNQKAVIVKESELQNKSGRYFFNDTLRLGAGETYVSPMDLNIERGKIEQPHKPMLRFGTPVINRAGKKQGILMINYYGQELLDDFIQEMNEKQHAMLLNSDGYWLSNPEQAKEWGFMFGRDDTFGKYHPQVWSRISTETKGSILAATALYTFTTAYPLLHAQQSRLADLKSNGLQTGNLPALSYYWKIVSLIPAADLPAVSPGQYPRAFALFGLTLLLLVLLAIYIASTMLSRRQLRVAIFESESKLNVITSTLGEGIYVVDQHGLTTFINPEAERLLGWTRAELMGQHAHNLFHYRSLDGSPILADDCEIYSVIQSGKTYRSATQVFWRKDGSYLNVDVSASPILRDGKISGAVVAFNDISKQKQSENALSNSETQLKLAQRLAQLGSWELDLITQKLVCSDEIYRIFEIEPGSFDASYETFLNLVHPQDRKRVNRAYIDSVQNHTSYNHEHRLLFADGRIKHVQERGETFYDANDRPIRSIGTVQDITARKRAENERQRAEMLFQMVFNNVADGIVIHDISGRFMEVNQVFCERLGYSREELLQLSPADIDDPEGAAKFAERARQLKEHGQITIETVHVSKQGRKIPVEVSARLIEYQRNPAILSVVRDISERKATQDALRTSKETARTLLNATSESATLMDVSGIVVAINRVGASRLGKRPDQVIGRNMFEFLPAKIADNRKRIMEEVVRSGHPSQFHDEHDGMHLDHSVYPIMDAQGKVIQIAIYATDITERIRLQAEETLLQRIDQQVLHSSSLSALMQFICDEVVQLFGYHFAWLGKKEAEGEFSIAAQSGNASAYLQDLLRIGVRWDDTPQGKGPAGACIRSGKMQVLKISDSDFQPWQDAAERFGFKSIVGIPLIVRGQVYGVLLLYSRFEHDFDDTLSLQRLSGIGRRICVAVETAMDHEQLRLLSTALASAGNGVFITDSLGHILWVNNSFTRLTGYSGDESIGHSPALLKSGQHEEAFYQLLWQTIQQGKTWSNETVERHKSGRLFTVQQTITPIKNDEGVVSHFVSILDDITEQKETAARIQHMAHFDALTSLPNRALFHDRLSQVLVQAKRDGNISALMYIDLDRFKEVNDTLGHHVGDLLLQAVADRLKACVRETDSVSRLAGDEFTVLLPHVHSQEDASLIAEKITKALATTFILDGHEVNIGSSTGIAFYPTDADSDEALIKCADRAMYLAKEQGRGTFRFYQPK